MTYKETLFFIGKCLTITHEEHNRSLVEEKLKKNSIDWDSVVKVSTSHYVFPAVYCNLKRNNFLHYLPTDLVAYMKHITDLNRERNQQIINQAKEINELLLLNNITPIFLKGTGNLLEGLYEDIGERMVGDIDFIVSENNYHKTIDLVLKNKYSKADNSTKFLPASKHYPRLMKKGKIAAIEIHKELLLKKYSNEFNYSLIKNKTLISNKITCMSYENQLCLSIFAKQINDYGIIFKNIALRNAYDAFILSKKTNSKIISNKFNKLKLPLNNFLALCYEVFNKPDSLYYETSVETKKYIKTFYKLLSNKNYSKNHFKINSLKIFLTKRIHIIYKSLFIREYRIWLFKKITNKNWQNEKLVQLRLKKSKSTP